MKNLSKKGLVAGALVGCMAITGISAYFTDTETVTNTFEASSGVKADLTEPSWDEDNAKDLVPLKTVAKDPTVTNTGDISEYVFIEVEVPYDNVVVANADGSLKTAADTELFTYTINSGWVEVGSSTKNTTKKVVKHVYAYGTSSKMTALTAGQSATLFNSVTFANLTDVPSDTSMDIVITSKAIQTTDLNGNKVAPADVYAIVNNQI